MRPGEDFAGGLFRRLYAPSNPAGLWYALAVAVVLIVLHQLLQVALAFGIMLFLKVNPGVTREFVKAGLVAIFPASLIVFGISGSVLWFVGALMAICNVAGAVVGARTAIARGSEFVRTVLLIVTAVLIAVLAVQIIRG